MFPGKDLGEWVISKQNLKRSDCPKMWLDVTGELQETWRLTFGAEGKAMVERHVDGVVAYYVECTAADNHAVREAACHCIAELAAKIDRAVLAPHVQRLLSTLLECFKDDSWCVILTTRNVMRGRATTSLMHCCAFSKSAEL